MGDIVIGVDGSPPSQRALHWALDEARLRGAALTVVGAYRPSPVHAPHATIDPYVPAETMQAATAYRRGLQEEQDARDQRQAERVLDQTLQAAGEHLGDVVVKPFAVAGDPGRVLVERSRHAELLVVGSRGRGGVRGLLLGSVSQHVVHHADCPVVVIR